MDINLFGKNGLMFVRELCEMIEVVLMFLIGCDNEIDKILGLEIGVDDYIIKLFNFCELIICVRNLFNCIMVEEKEIILIL